MLWIIPNILTFGRLGLTGVFLVMLLYSPSVTQQNLPWFLDIAFAVFIIAGLTDVIDGIAARRFNVASKFGRMMDPLVDKVLVCGSFICFAVIKEPVLFDIEPLLMSLIRWLVAAVLISRELYVTVLRHTSEAHGINFAATLSGKVKMFLQTFAIGTVIIKSAHVGTPVWADIFTTVVFAAMVIVTIISGIRATRRVSVKQTAA